MGGLVQAISSPVGVFERMAERDRVRTLRMQRHLAFAGVAAMSLVLLSPFVDTVGEFALLPVLVGVIVRSVARGADARFGHIWGWIYEEPQAPTKLDRLVDRLIERTRPPMPADPAGEMKVRTLEPFGG